MSAFPDRLVEIGEYFGEGYKPILDFKGWRVAVLRRGDATTAGALTRVERHNETNEVFILTAGQADLVVCDGGNEPTDVLVTAMELNVAYNIRDGVWHHIVMSEDSHVILVEKTNTSRENSDYHDLTPEQIATAKASLTVTA
jgi:hypothetical protein